MEKTKEKLKFRLLTWAAVLFLSVSGAVCSDVSIAQAEEMVYVTPTGSKYHAYKCGNGTYTLTTLSNALSRGLTPCSKCYGSNYSPAPEPEPAPAPEPEPEPTPAPKPMKINKTSVILVKGQTAKLKVSNAAGPAAWSSSKKSVASVSGSGKVTAKKKGKAVITANANAGTKKCKVTVEDPRLSAKSISLDLKQSKKLKLTGCKHSVKWTSSNSSVAKVSKGKVTAKRVGSAKITAKAHGKKFTCKVTVKKPKVKEINLGEGALQMEYGEEKELKLRIVPSNAVDYYDISVKSSDTSVAEASLDNYDNTVLLRSKEKEGTAEISVSIGGVTAKCRVTVIKPAVEELTLSETSLTLKPDESKTISYGVTPYDAADYHEEVWSSKDESVVTVEKNYRRATVKAVGEGETDITLTLGNKTAICHVAVAKPTVEELTLSETSLTLKPDESKGISYGVAPYDAADYHEEVWSSEDENVVTVEKNYRRATVKAVGEGETDITLTLGNKTAICHVAVAKPTVEELTLSETSLTLKPDESKGISYGVAPYDAADYHEEVWSSKDESVVTVEKNYRRATVKAVGEGETDITLTLGNKTVTCHVTVQP